jgi:hypothetical protein
MSRQGSAGGTTSDTARRGLARLMLKLPALRAGLQDAASQSRALDELFEAYEIAAVALETFRRGGDRVRTGEYEGLCTGIEDDVTQHILRTNSPKRK